MVVIRHALLGGIVTGMGVGLIVGLPTILGAAVGALLVSAGGVGVLDAIHASRELS